MKKLVLFSDGTGNSSAKAQTTNVWRMFQALDQTTPDQLAKYDDGVGTSSIKFLAALGGAFGFGLKRNVIDLYKFVCRNHVPGDEIHGFGFSRGAFTIRVLVGLIATQGLVSARSESELHAMALAAYRQYRIERFPSKSPLVWLGRALRDLVTWPFNSAERALHLRTRPAPNSVPIRFLGLWDTVGAYGMPIDELKWGLSMLVWPMVAIDAQLFPCVARACHALALDDQRETFHPTLFDEEIEARFVKANPALTGRLTQVWFAGVHSNVGGGYPEDKASLVPLDWMFSQAIACGLRFNADALPSVAEDKSAYARLYDSRAGIAAYYRYSPRRIALGVDTEGAPILPIVHGSVVMRMAEGSDAYAPISLPEKFDVLAPDGRLLPMRGFQARSFAPPTRAGLPQSTTAAAQLAAARTVALQQAIAKMGRPDEELVRQVRDTVWWRRISYFACLAATLLVVGFPFASTLYAKALHAGVDALGRVATEWDARASQGVDLFNEMWHGDIQALITGVKPFVPSYLDRWLAALAAHPLEMTIALVCIAIPFALGRRLGARVHDRAWFAWHPARAADYLDWLAQSARRSAVNAGLALAVVAALTGIGLAHHWHADALIALAAAVLLLAGLLAWRWRVARRVAAALAAATAAGGAPVLPTPTLLRLARWLRTNAPLVTLYTVLTEKIIPIAVGLAVLIGAAVVAHHLVYHAADTAGIFCSSSGHPIDAPPDANAEPLALAGRFDASQACWASGVRVIGGARYEVTLRTPGDWVDHGRATDVRGYAADDATHLLSAPLKRVWSADWFAPMLRIGRIGSDELAMTAVSPTQATVTFTAPHDGELFLYVNDAVLMLPRASEMFYRNNVGSGSLAIKRLPALARP